MRGLLRGRWEKAQKSKAQIERERSQLQSDAHAEAVEEQKQNSDVVQDASSESDHMTVELEQLPLKAQESIELSTQAQQSLSENFDLQAIEDTPSLEEQHEDVQGDESAFDYSLPYEKGPKVLILDDDNQMLEIVGAIVQSAGGVPLKALNGAHAMEFVEEDNIQLVILDLHMPEMNGVTFLQGVRRLGVLENVPVFILTGRPDKNVLEEFKPLSVQGCIVKPFHPDDMKQIVEQHLKFDEDDHA